APRWQRPRGPPGRARPYQPGAGARSMRRPLSTPRSVTPQPPGRTPHSHDGFAVSRRRDAANPEDTPGTPDGPPEASEVLPGAPPARRPAREAVIEGSPVTEVRVPAATGHPEEATDEPGQQAPGPAPRGVRPALTGPFGIMQWVRWGWRQLTSMRTALILLFLLALRSVPGSVLPQQGIDPQAVQQYYDAHPALAPSPPTFPLSHLFPP